MQINIETHMHLEMHVSEKLGPLLGHRYDRCLIVIDSGFGETDKAKAIVDNLNKYYTTKVIEILSSNEPTYQNIAPINKGVIKVGTTTVCTIVLVSLNKCLISFTSRTCHLFID